MKAMNGLLIIAVVMLAGFFAMGVPPSIYGVLVVFCMIALLGVICGELMWRTYDEEILSKKK